MQMRLSRADQIGEAGQAAVISFFNDLGWGPLPTGKHDLGTDAFVQVRADDLLDLGMMLGVQVKTGDSWFGRPAEVEGQAGWWFAEDSDKHRSYWTDHHIPHLLVLQDESRTRRHWVRLDRTTIESTGKGIKVFVPAHQVLAEGAAEEWISLVAEARKLHSFEGASWTFNIAQVPESEWPRYALLAPRIVAPHPNQGHAHDINWAEALALAVQAEHQRWDGFAEARENVPSAAEAAKSDDVGWRFAAAVYQWMNGPTDQLEYLAEADLPASLRVAHAVCVSSILEARGEPGEALELLGTLQDAEHPSIEQAWIALHRGWLLYEAGDFAGADEQVNLSVAMHNSFPSGLVNSAIRSAGIVALFDMAPFMTGDVAAVVQASDTTLSWWRNHQVENALNRYLRNSFKRWSDDGSVTFSQSDSTNNDLFSAQLSARLLGNRRSERYAAYLRAIANLSLPRGSHVKAEDQFDALRSSGYQTDLVAALNRFRRDGPLDPLSAFMSNIRPGRSTTTSIRADLESVQVAGSYLEAENAFEWLTYLLDSFDNPNVHVSRYRLHFDPRRDLLDAVAGLRVHYRPEDEERLIRIALSLPADADQLLVRSISRCIDGVREGTIAQRAPELAVRAAELAVDSGAGRFLIDTASPYDAAARAEVSRRMIAGDLSSIPNGFRVDELSLTEASAVAERCQIDMGAYVGQLNGIGIGAPDPYLTLAMIAFFGPPTVREAAWNYLIEGLSETDVIHERKGAALDYLARAAGSVPASHAPRLIEVATALREEPPRFSGIPFSYLGPHAPACNRLLLALGDENEQWEQSIGEMLLGASEDRQFAVRILSARPGHELLLLALSKDSDGGAARAALHGLARRATEDPRIAKLAMRILMAAVQQGGEQAALHVGGGVLAASERCAEAEQVVDALRNHQSANIRKLAAELDEVST